MVLLHEVVVEEAGLDCFQYVGGRSAERLGCSPVAEEGVMC